MNAEDRALDVAIGLTLAGKRWPDFLPRDARVSNDHHGPVVWVRGIALRPTGRGGRFDKKARSSR